MSAWTNAYWPRSGERGSTSTRSSSLRTRRVESALEARRPVDARDGGERVERERLAEDGGVLDQRPVGRVERVEARRDQRVERVRDGELAQLPAGS